MDDIGADGAAFHLQVQLFHQFQLGHTGQQLRRLLRGLVQLLGQYLRHIVAGGEIVVKPLHQLQTAWPGQKGEEAAAEAAVGEIGGVACLRPGPDGHEGQLLRPHAKEKALLDIHRHPQQNIFAAHPDGAALGILQLRHSDGIHTVVHDGAGGRPCQTAQFTNALSLGERYKPPNQRAFHVLHRPAFPAKKGVDGHAQPVGQGGEELHVWRAALFPFAHRLGGHTQRLAQLLLGEAPFPAQFSDAFAQYIGHKTTSIRLMVVS